MTQFKLGDRVRCVNTEHIPTHPLMTSIKIGSIYTVTHTGYTQVGFETESPERLPVGTYTSSQFELVKFTNEERVQQRKKELGVD